MKGKVRAIMKVKVKIFYRHPLVTASLLSAKLKPNIPANNHKCPTNKQCEIIVLYFCTKDESLSEVSGSKSQLHSFTAFTFSPENPLLLFQQSPFFQFCPYMISRLSCLNKAFPSYSSHIMVTRIRLHCQIYILNTTPPYFDHCR